MYILAEVNLPLKMITFYSTIEFANSDAASEDFANISDTLIKWINVQRNGYGLCEQDDWQHAVITHVETISSLLVLIVAAELCSGRNIEELDWSDSHFLPRAYRISLDIIRGKHSLWSVSTQQPDPKPLQLKSSLGGCNIGGNTLDMLGKKLVCMRYVIILCRSVNITAFSALVLSCQRNLWHQFNIMGRSRRWFRGY